MIGFPVAPQSMSGRKSVLRAQSQMIAQYTATSGSATITATRNCWAFIILFGPGGSGSTGGGGSCGGAGGAALYRRVRLIAGQRLTYALGTPGAGVGSADTVGVTGTASTVTLPNGNVLSAGGGQGGPASAGTAAGGTATGGDVNVSGSSATFGGTSVNGGAAADISASMPGVTGGATGSTAPPAAGNSPGGGSRGDAANVATGAGGNPLIVVTLVRTF